MQLSWKRLLLIALLLAGIVLAVLSWEAMAIRKESEYHEYRYRVSLSAPSLLENCTLLLPVPFAGNISPLGETLDRGGGYNIPPGWKVSLELVKGTPMLKILAPKIVPEYHGYPIPVEPGTTPAETPPPVATAWSDETPVLMPLDFGISLRATESIDTKNPFGREPLLSDPALYMPAACLGSSRSGQCYRYRAPVSVHCSSGAGGNLTVSISTGGTNQWWMGGWIGNSYGEDIEVIIRDTRQGWTEGEGFLSTGMGRY